jgi:para-aminobenzoate synthetase
MKVEPHPTVFQMVSAVRGRLAAAVGRFAAVRALFPGGSMTGAPKIRAMRILGALEGAPRGVYAGGIGMVSFAGVVDLAMAIRTIVVSERELSFGVGGAVTVLSDAEAELDEALAKAAALERAIALAYEDGQNGQDGHLVQVDD